MLHEFTYINRKASLTAVHMHMIFLVKPYWTLTRTIYADHCHMIKLPIKLQ